MKENNTHQQVRDTRHGKRKQSSLTHLGLHPYINILQRKLPLNFGKSRKTPREKHDSLNIEATNESKTWLRKPLNGNLHFQESANTLPAEKPIEEVEDMWEKDMDDVIDPNKEDIVDNCFR